MAKAHAPGGWTELGSINTDNHELSVWEKRTDALLVLLSATERRVLRVDELRRAIESLPADAHETMTYYERTAVERCQGRH